VRAARPLPGCSYPMASIRPSSGRDVLHGHGYGVDETSELMLMARSALALLAKLPGISALALCRRGFVVIAPELLASDGGEAVDIGA